MQNQINSPEERIHQIEADRHETMSSKDFVQWFIEMRIASRLPKKPVMETDRHHFDTTKINFQFKF